MRTAPLNALALHDASDKHPVLYGTRAQLSAPGGDVEGYLTLAGCDRRAGTASYALRVSNQSPHALRARMTCARIHGERIRAYPLDVHIAPYSLAETLLPVRMADVGPFERAIVQVAGGNVAFSLEAPAPPKARGSARWISAGGAVAALTLFAALGAAAATPRIGLVAAPAKVLSGNSLDVPYAFGGWAAMQYALKTADGRQVTAGLVNAHQGTLHFIVPAAAGRNVVLSVAVAGPFGARSAQQTIAVTPTPNAPRVVRKPVVALPVAPRISEFTVATPVVHANGTLAFSYATSATDGEIWLIDEAGRLWARTPITPYGTASLKLPQATAGRQMRAVLHARTGKLDSVASLGITVLPDAVMTAVPKEAAARKPAGMLVRGGGPVLTLSNDHPAPGDTITVAIEGAHGDTNVSLNDAAGNSVEQGDIPAGQDAVTISAPSAGSSSAYYVTANVTDGMGTQLLVRKITVTPR